MNLSPQPLTERRRKEIASLQQKKYRDRLGQMVVEGLRSVESAVEAGAPLVELVVAESRRADPAIEALLKAAGVPFYAIKDADLARLSDVETAQGILAVVRLPGEEAAWEGVRRVLALDAVQDPGNVGTLVRTAAWFGIDAVLAGPGSADLFSPKVVRSAMGGLWDVVLSRSPDLPRSLGDLREKGFALYAADLEGSPPDEWHPSAPSVLVLGSEAHGVSAEVRALVGGFVSIPGNPGRRGAESLNVSVAGGILMQQWTRTGA